MAKTKSTPKKPKNNVGGAGLFWPKKKKKTTGKK
jgi:hypothetical protein